MRTKTSLLVQSLVLSLAMSGYAQNIANIKAEVLADKIIITYDLLTPPPGSWVDVKIYGSHNAFAAPITNVTGAVGKVAIAGKGKKIEWRHGKILDNFNGNLSFEIETEIVYNLAFIKPKKSIRRGKDNIYKWKGGRPDDIIHVLLVSSNKDVAWENSLANKDGIATVRPGQKLALDRAYQLELVSKDDKVTLPLKLKKKTNLFWIIAPSAVVAGAAVYFLLPDSEKGLPNAPEPPKI